MTWHAWEAVGRSAAVLFCLLAGGVVLMDLRSQHMRLIGASAADIRRAARVLLWGGGAAAAASALAWWATLMQRSA